MLGRVIRKVNRSLLSINASLTSNCTAGYSNAIEQQRSPLLLERLAGAEDGILLIRLNRPDTKNAISKVLLEMFRHVLMEIKFDRQARVVVLKSDVKGAFCSGADLKERRTMPVEDVPRFVDNIRGLASDLEALPIPTIAAIDGFALGGGLEMALACDIRIAGSNAKMGLTETKLGIIPGAGGTQRLTRAIGVSKAKELIFTGRMVNGDEAQRMGIVNHSVEQNGDGDAAFQRALTLAKEILPQGPIAVKLAKIAIDRGAQVDINNGLTIEQQCYAQVLTTKDRLEGLKAFAEKRTPVYKGE